MKPVILLIALFMPFICYSQYKKAKYPYEVLINGKIGVWTHTQNEVVAMLGKPDSIIYDPSDCGRSSDFDSVMYLREIRFEKKRDTVDFFEMNFSDHSKDFVQFGKLKLTAWTTMEDVKRYYAYSPNRDTSEVEGFIPNKKTRLLAIEVSSEVNDHQKWYLLFYHERLIRLLMWLDC